MQAYNLENPNSNIGAILNAVSANKQPVKITQKDEDFVVVPMDEWKSMQETMYLHSVPGLVEKILEASAEPLESCTPLEDVEW